MKHNLFRNFTALLLSGTMLAGVGCKDYDDDIDNINKRLDEMEVTISSLPEQLEAIKQSIPDLSSLTSRVSELEGKLEGVTDLKGQLATLNGLEDKLTKYVDDEIGKATTADALKATLGNYFATATALSDLESKLEGLDVDKSISDAITALKNDASNWMGEPMQAYLDAKGYATKSTTISEATSAAAAEVLNQIKAEQSEYKTAIEAIVANATINNVGVGVVGKTALDDELTSLIEKIEPLIDRVAELEGRIQSLVYVPSTLDEAQNNTITFEGASYIEFGPDDLYYLGLADEQSARITFRVSPASLVDRINDENISFIVEKVTRADAPSFTAKILDKDAKTGKFTVLATTDYIYGSEPDKTLAIALNVNIAPAEGSESEYGIDYTTSFIGTDYTAGGAINDKLVIAKAPAEEGGQYIEVADEGTYASELEYTSTETVEFFKDFDVYYEPENGKYYALTDMWENAPKLDVVEPTEAATASAHADSYTLTATTALIKTSATSLINDVITSKDFTFNVKAGNKTLEVGTVKQTVTIIGVNTDIDAQTAIAMTWNYATATSGNAYSVDNIVLKNAVSAAIYNKMAAYTKDATLSATKYTIQLTENGQPVTGIDAAIELVSTPSVDSDAQLIKVTLTGDLKETATYALKAVYMHDDLTTATINATINVTGMPEFAAYEIAPAQKTYVGGYTFPLLENFADVLWNDNLKAAFGDKETFQGIVYAATAASTKNGKADLAVNSSNSKLIEVTFDNDAAYDKAYTPSIKFTDATIADLVFTFKSNVTLVEPTATLEANEAYIKDGKATAKTTLTGSTFQVEQKELAGAFEYKGDLAGTQIVYSINESEEDLDALTDAQKTIPAISDNVLTWNDWNKLDLKVKAELVLGNKVLATVPFVVTINDPVAEAISLLENVDATIYAGESDRSFNVASLLKLDAQNGTNVFDATTGDGLNADLKTALKGSVVYTLAEGTNSVISLEGSKVKLADSALEINEFSVKVTVKYTYQFDTRTTEVKILVKPGTKPAEEPGN